MTTPDPSTALTPGMRKDIARLIDQKAENVRQALAGEITTNPTAVLRRLLADHGIHQTVDEMQNEMWTLQRQIRDVDIDEDETVIELREQKETTESSVSEEAEAIRRDYEARIASLKAEMNRKMLECTRLKPARIAELTAAIDARIAKVYDDEAPGAYTRLEALKKDLSEAKRLEQSLRPEIERQARVIEKSRGRLIHLVNDAVVKAKVDLLKCSTTVEAHGYLDAIPTVAELINIAEDPERGLDELVKRFHPSHQLAIAPPKLPDEQSDDSPTPVEMPVRLVEVE